MADVLNTVQIHRPFGQNRDVSIGVLLIAYQLGIRGSYQDLIRDLDSAADGIILVKHDRNHEVKLVVLELSEWAELNRITT